MTEVWRIVYRYTASQNWQPLSNMLYHTKGMASGVMKRHGGLIKEDWDDSEKVWIRHGANIMYRLQSSKIDWQDYVSN